MSIPSTIAEYLSCFSQELGDRILQIYPALQGEPGGTPRGMPQSYWSSVKT
jgi:hypothetical protein